MKFNIKFSPPDIQEEDIRAVEEVLRSGWITTGPKVKQFEQEISKFCGTNCAVALNSATACLEMTLRLLGIGPGDEVITSPYTYTATCSVICHVGATPVLVDLQPGTFEMNYDKLEDYINERTKAIIPVDIAGIMCDYGKILDIIDKKRNMFRPNNELQERIGRVCVIADAAHSLGAEKNGIKSGNAADFTCFSFHAVKNLTTAEGGAVTWRNINNIENQEIYNKFMILSLHGQNKDALSKYKLNNWEYDILLPGYKFNMTDISAALGLSQLNRYNKILTKRREIVQFYNKELNKNKFWSAEHLTNGLSSCHLYPIRILEISEHERNNIITKLFESGINVNVHYKPLPMLSAYKNMGFKISDFPEAYNMYKNEITLPLHTLLNTNELEYITTVLRKIV